MVDFKPPQLYPYQVEGVRWLVENVAKDDAQGRLLADGRGLGKTAQLVSAARELYQSHPPVSPFVPLIIVLAPGTARADWLREFSTWWPACRAEVVWGEKQIERLHDDQSFRVLDSASKPLALILSIHDKAMENARTLVDRVTLGGLPFLTLIDEAHHLKNSKALRTTAAQYYAGSPWRLMLATGTPIFNKPPDLFALLQLMDRKRHPNFWGWAKKYFFMHEVIKDGVRYGMKVGSLIHGDRLKADSQHLIFGRSAQEVWKDLPARRITIRKVKAKAPRVSPAKLRLMEREASAFREILSKCAEAKLTEVSQYLADSDEPAVAYVYERAHAVLLSEKLEKLGVSNLSATGAQPPEKRAKTIGQWKAGEARVLICTMDAVKESATLTRAALMVFADFDFVWSKVLQCMGRIDPARQPVSERRPASYVFFAIDGGPDEVVADVLLEKIQSGTVLVADDVAAELGKELASSLGKAYLPPSSESTEDILKSLVARIEARAALEEELR